MTKRKTRPQVEGPAYWRVEVGDFNCGFSIRAEILRYGKNPVRGMPSGVMTYLWRKEIPWGTKGTRALSPAGLRQFADAVEAAIKEFKAKPNPWDD